MTTVTDEMVEAFGATFYTSWPSVTNFKNRLRKGIRAGLEAALAAAPSPDQQPDRTDKSRAIWKAAGILEAASKLDMRAADLAKGSSRARLHGQAITKLADELRNLAVRTRDVA